MENLLSQQTRPLSRRRGDYGIDAPYVPIMLDAFGVGFLIIAILGIWQPSLSFLTTYFFFFCFIMFLSSGSYIYTTRIGKFQVWSDILNQLGLKGNERVLDMGCGRGAVLLMAAQRLSTGRAIGIDLWKSSDQSGNALTTTQRNAELEGVAGRVDLYTEDMCKLSFADNSFDVVLSSLAIHNITDATGREQAIDEAVRMLKPGGKLAIADIRSTQQYMQRLQELGMSDVTHRTLDWRSWYGGPWMATKLVSATKPL